MDAVPCRLVGGPKRERLRVVKMIGIGRHLSKKEIQRTGVPIGTTVRGNIRRRGAVKFIKDAVK